MGDKREQILVQLLAILTAQTTGGSPLAKTAVRNRVLRTNEERPGLVLLDGDERQRTTLDRKAGRGGHPFAPQIMLMSPQIFILTEEQRPTNDTIGPKTNALRSALLEAIANDATLATLVGSNGSILLNATVTDMKSGGAVTGQMMLDFFITYPLIPA